MLQKTFSCLFRSIYHIVDNAVSTNKINNYAVTEDKLGYRAVTTQKIGLEAVATENIADMSVTKDKIATGAVHGSELADGAIDSSSLLANGVITSNKIINGAITTEKIANEAITKAKLATELARTMNDPDWVITCTDTTIGNLLSGGIDFVGGPGVYMDSNGNHITLATFPYGDGNFDDLEEYIETYSDGLNGLLVLDNPWSAAPSGANTALDLTHFRLVQYCGPYCFLRFAGMAASSGVLHNYAIDVKWNASTGLLTRISAIQVS